MINPRKNGFTAGEIFVTPFRLSVDRQSTIFTPIASCKKAALPIENTVPFYSAKHAVMQFEIHPKESRFHGLTF